MSLIINKQELLRAAPIKNMATEKLIFNGMSYGLSEAGYDIRIKQEVVFKPGEYLPYSYGGGDYRVQSQSGVYVDQRFRSGRFCLASSVEEFDMPADMIGRVHDKSSWARRGLSVFNTVIEPGWKGFLTLELRFEGDEEITIPAGSPIAQVIFENTVHSATYNGKYQNQKDEPVTAITEVVKIVGEHGVIPHALDNAIKQQREYYYQPDPSQRGFTPL